MLAHDENVHTLILQALLTQTVIANGTTSLCHAHISHTFVLHSSKMLMQEWCFFLNLTQEGFFVLQDSLHVTETENGD